VIITVIIIVVPVVVATIGSAVTVITSIKSTVTVVVAVVIVLVVVIVSPGFLGLRRYLEGAFYFFTLPHSVLCFRVELALVVYDHV
jgi:hypothetical protein